MTVCLSTKVMRVFLEDDMPECGGISGKAPVSLDYDPM